MIRCNLILFFAFLYNSAVTQTLVVTYRGAEKFPTEAIDFMPGLAAIDVSYYSGLQTDGKRSRRQLDSLVIHNYGHNGNKILIRQALYLDYTTDRTYQVSAHFPLGQADIKVLSEQYQRVEEYEWTDQTREILGIPCLLARHKINGTEVWYAPSIPYPNGPDRFTWGFPGLVLATDRPTYSQLATKIEYRNSPVDIPHLEQISTNKMPDLLGARDVSSLSPDEYLILNALQPKNVALTFDD